MTGPLKAPCEHGRYEAHSVEQVTYKDFLDKAVHEYHPKTDPPTYSPPDPEPCPGGSLLPPEDTLVIVKEDGLWASWAVNALWQIVGPTFSPSRLLDALAAAQRGDE